MTKNITWDVDTETVYFFGHFIPFKPVLKTYKITTGDTNQEPRLPPGGSIVGWENVRDEIGRKQLARREALDIDHSRSFFPPSINDKQIFTTLCVGAFQCLECGYEHPLSLVENTLSIGCFGPSYFSCLPYPKKEDENFLKVHLKIHGHPIGAALWKEASE